jgi:hypothetical protein
VVACVLLDIGLARSFFDTERMLDRDVRKAYLE